MALVTRRVPLPTWDPVAEMDILPSTMRRLLESSDMLPAFRERVAWMPSVDVAESDDELVIAAELPGLAAEDVNVRVENGVLTISGEKREARETKEKNGKDKRRFHVFERYYGAFTRTFSLPRAVNAEKVTAAFANGVLTVTLPKLAEAKGHIFPVVTK
jgi:HSP20 family protein